MIIKTTPGYGHSTPATVGGRSFCMVYALIGIPLGLVMFQSIGERLNTFVRVALGFCKKLFKAKNKEVTQTHLVMVVTALSTILMTSMAAVFAEYERWNYFDSLYYCFITLTTIGFGDFVALQKEAALQSKPEYVVLSLIFILFGLSVVSSAVNLLVLKFLTLNTEDERRDEQLRYTASLNTIQLDGDVITPGSAPGSKQQQQAHLQQINLVQIGQLAPMGRINDDPTMMLSSKEEEQQDERLQLQLQLLDLPNNNNNNFDRYPPYYHNHSHSPKMLPRNNQNKNNKITNSCSNSNGNSNQSKQLTPSNNYDHQLARASTSAGSSTGECASSCRRRRAGPHCNSANSGDSSSSGSGSHSDHHIKIWTPSSLNSSINHGVSAEVSSRVSSPESPSDQSSSIVLVTSQQQQHDHKLSTTPRHHEHEHRHRHHYLHNLHQNEPHNLDHDGDQHCQHQHHQHHHHHHHRRQHFHHKHKTTLDMECGVNGRDANGGELVTSHKLTSPVGIGKNSGHQAPVSSDQEANSRADNLDDLDGDNLSGHLYHNHDHDRQHHHHGRHLHHHRRHHHAKAAHYHPKQHYCSRHRDQHRDAHTRQQGQGQKQSSQLSSDANVNNNDNDNSGMARCSRHNLENNQRQPLVAGKDDGSEARSKNNLGPSRDDTSIEIYVDDNANDTSEYPLSAEHAHLDANDHMEHERSMNSPKGSATTLQSDSPKQEEADFQHHGDNDDQRNQNGPELASLTTSPTMASVNDEWEELEPHCGHNHRHHLHHHQLCELHGHGIHHQHNHQHPDRYWCRPIRTRSLIRMPSRSANANIDVEQGVNCHCTSSDDRVHIDHERHDNQ